MDYLLIQYGVIQCITMKKPAVPEPGIFSGNFHTLCGTSHTETSTNIMERSGRVGWDAWVLGRLRTLVGRCVPYCGVSRRVAKSEKSVKSVKFGKFGKRRRSQWEVGGVSLGVGLSVKWFGLVWFD